MFSYQIQLYENKQWQNLTSWARPFTDGTALDDSLDAGCINLSLSTRSEPIKPFTPIRIIISENGKEVDRIFRLVASTKRTRRTFAPSVQKLYDWTINTIELTKQLERRFIGTLTSTRYLSTDYNEKYASALDSKTTDYSGVDLDVVLVERNKIMKPYKNGSNIAIPGIQYYPELDTDGLFSFDENAHYGRVFRFGIYPCTVTIKIDDTTIYTKTHVQQRFDTENITIPDTGNVLTITYDTKYESAIIGTTNYESNTLKVEYKVSVFTQIAPKTQPTITSVCQRLLSSGITTRYAIQSQEFSLEPAFEIEYEDVSAPEFSFTNCTLFEALAQVGGYIHAIPRLIPTDTNGTSFYVTFDKLGGSEQAPNMPPVVYQDSVINVNDWCGTIASPAQNLCNTTDSGGSITELANDYITVRAADGQIEINGDNIVIRVPEPMQKLVKLECGYIPEYADGKTPVGDISAYAYEDAEYSVLSSYWGTAYPYSKAWALRWKQGSDTIDGLVWRNQEKTSVGTAFGNTAILNIINAKTGLDLKATGKGALWYRQLAFRVTYVPIVTARVEAVKPVASEGGETKNTLVYNQGANVAETSFYGEKMRGAIARLGQDVEQRTYDITTYSQMPKIGQILDGKYIATIDAEYDITRIRITLTLTKNFNQLSEYIGLNSNYRLYDISEKQSVERHIHYADKIYIGSTRQYSSGSTIIQYVNQMLEKTFFPVLATTPDIKKVQTVGVLPFSDGNAMLDRAVILPVAAFPFGTSLCFNFSFYDNYGAGYQSTDTFKSDNEQKAVQRLVPYTDVYGEISHLQFFAKNTGWTPTIDDQKDGGKAMLYPQFDYENADRTNAFFKTATGLSVNNRDGALVINKDSREKIDVTYQVHFVATSDDYVIGPGLTEYCRYVTSRTLSYEEMARVHVLWLNHTINSLNKFVDNDGYDQTINYANPNYTTENGVFMWTSMTCPQDAVAYAVCKKKDDKYILLFGRNVEISKGESTKEVYFEPSAYD